MACSPEPTLDQQIIGTILEMEEHAENGEPGRFMDYVADDFTGQDGNLSRADFRRYMNLQMSRYARLSAQLMPITVSAVGTDRAEARFKALVTGGQGLIPEQGQIFFITTEWVRQGGDWQLVGADWDRLVN